MDRGLPTAALGPNHSQSLFARRGMKADRDSAPRAACRCGAVCSGRRGPSRLPGPSAGACSSLAGSESRVRAAGGPPESRRRAGPPWYPNRSGDCHAAIKAPASEAPVLNVRGLRNLPVGLGTGTIRDFRVTSQQFKKKSFSFHEPCGFMIREKTRPHQMCHVGEHEWPRHDAGGAAQAAIFTESLEGSWLPGP